MADIKTEIKPDPEAGASPSVFEEDIYEDAGDLEFNTESTFDAAYLVRLPTHLWDAWTHLDEDAEIQIGKIRIDFTQQPDGRQGVGFTSQMRSEG